MLAVDRFVLMAPGARCAAGFVRFMTVVVHRLPNETRVGTGYVQN